MYHVALDVTPEQKRQLKLLALTRTGSVQSFMTELVLQELEKETGEEEEIKKAEVKQ